MELDGAQFSDAALSRSSSESSGVIQQLMARGRNFGISARTVFVTSAVFTRQRSFSRNSYGPGTLHANGHFYLPATSTLLILYKEAEPR